MVCPYGKKVFVTGGTSGIGKAVVEAFAEQGYLVYAVSRRAEEKTVSMGSGTVCYMKMDVRDTDSIRNVAKKVDRDLSIIVHAAGYGIGGAAEDTPLDAVREQFETNYFGVLAVNQEFLPILRKNERSLVVVISSIAGRVSLPFQSHYSSTKYALEAYVQALSVEAKPFGVRAVLVEPGDLQTDFTKERQHKVPAGSPYEEAYAKTMKAFEKDENNGDCPAIVAKAVLKCAGKRNPPVRLPVGCCYRVLMFLLRFFPDKFTRFVVSKLYSC